MRTLRGAGVSVLAVLATAACSASSGPAGSGFGEENGGSSGSGGTIPGTGGSISIGGTSGSGGTIVPEGGSSGSSGSGGSGADTCGTKSVKGDLVTEPVDIIVVLDNSGSMVEEMAAAETNIQNNFANILDAASVDFRMIMLSRHRNGPRTGSESAPDTSICISQPLSGLATCPSPDPVFSERYYQYNLKVESEDSFDKILLWYNTPDDDGDDALAPNGWGAWLRPGAKKVFVEMTDDNEDMTAPQFIAALTALSAEHFGSPEAPTFTFHTIMGIKEKAVPTDAYLPTEPVELATCTGNGADIVNAGPNYQELSITTGGLRFPLCQFPGYDAVFSRIAEDVIVTSNVQCDLEIPAPPAGQELDLTKVAVNFKPGNMGAPIEYGQAATSADCQENAFYIENNRIYLCEEACASLKEDPLSTVDVLFKCETTIIPPR